MLFCCAEIEARGTSGSLTGANLVMARNTTLLGNRVPTDDPSDHDSTSPHVCTGRAALTTESLWLHGKSTDPRV